MVFSPSKISMFSYEQAVVVTARQREALSDAQQSALALVLTPWEDRPLDFRRNAILTTLSAFLKITVNLYLFKCSFKAIRCISE